MSDTQWPEYIVFHQERADRPHDYAGGVHAPDAELALTNARDVFVRRPDCVSLWVVPVKKVFARTAEELAADPAWADGVSDNGTTQVWQVFQKLNHKGTHTHVGEVQGGSQDGALKAALSAYASPAVIVWWVVPDDAIVRSTPEDIAAMFAIAKRKTFRDQDEYHIVTAMREFAKKAKS